MCSPGEVVPGYQDPGSGVLHLHSHIGILVAAAAALVVHVHLWGPS